MTPEDAQRKWGGKGVKRGGIVMGAIRRMMEAAFVLSLGGLSVVIQQE